MRNTRSIAVPLAGTVHAGDPVEVFADEPGRLMVLLEIQNDELRAVDRRLGRGAICSLDPDPPTTLQEVLALKGQIVAARYPDGLLVGRFYPSPSDPRTGWIRYGRTSAARVTRETDLLGRVLPSEVIPI